VRRQRSLPKDIEERIATLGEALTVRPSIVFAYLFGGAAESRRTPLSDVDVAVFLEEDCDAIEERLEITRCLTRHLGTDEVDLVVLNSAPISLVGRILGTRRVVLDRDPFRRHRFESAKLREFFDFRVFERRHLALRFGDG